jgi:hypothetical protein
VTCKWAFPSYAWAFIYVIYPLFIGLNVHVLEKKYLRNLQFQFIVEIPDVQYWTLVQN